MPIKGFYLPFNSSRLTRLFLIILVALSSTSCSHVASMFSTPSYSVKNNDAIVLSNFDKNSIIYIQQQTHNSNDIGEKILEDVTKRFEKNNIKTTTLQEQATHVLGLNIVNITTDMEYDTANLIKNTMAFDNVLPSYIFDNVNSPHINNKELKNIKSKSKYSRRMMPSVLYTMIGSTLGFTTCFLAAGTFSPIIFGFIGGASLGGLTYYLYTTFRTSGILIAYEISVKEKTGHQIKHNVKALSRKSQNITDEVFYDYKDNWITHNSQGVIVATGSRALKDRMLSEMIPLASQNIVKYFSVK